MKSLIYYPSFEPQSEIWLKYALLYLDEFRPIIPHDRRHMVRPNYLEIMDGSDLINPYSPSFNTANDASIKAMDEIDRMISDPFRYSVLLNSADAPRRWKNRGSWNYQLYEEKFTYNFTLYCEDHALGMRTPDGLLLSEDLAFLYMTFLAASSAFESGCGVITDVNKVDRFTQYKRVFERDVMQRNNYAKSVISIRLPRNISEIPFSSIMEFRARNRNLLSHFNRSLSEMELGLEKMKSPADFVSEYLDATAAYTSELVTLGLGIIAVPFTFLTLRTNVALWPEYMHELLGFTGLAIGGAVALHRVFRDTETQRSCRKYLIRLESLS